MEFVNNKINNGKGLNNRICNMSTVCPKRKRLRNILDVMVEFLDTLDSHYKVANTCFLMPLNNQVFEKGSVLKHYS